MRRSVLLLVLCLLAASCSSAGAELTRMRAASAPANFDTPADEQAADDPVDDGEGDPTDDGDTADDVTTDSGDGEDDGTDDDSTDPDPGVRTIEPVVINRYPHDGAAFTQGLAWYDGVLIESLGLIGQSSLRRVVPTSGEVSADVGLPADQFGAGVAVVDDRLVQLTLQSEVAYVADPTTLTQLGQLDFEGQGWGLCQLDRGDVVMSDGSTTLDLRDAGTFAVIGQVDVTLEGAPVENLNELECVGGSVWANIWLDSRIVEIDIATGEVVTVVDATSLVPQGLAPDDVLNGIAHDPTTGTFYLTGKRWTVMYEVQLG